MSLESDIEQALTKGLMTHQNEMVQTAIDELKNCLAIIQDLRATNERYRSLIDEQADIIADLIKSRDTWRALAKAGGRIRTSCDCNDCE